MVEKDEKSIQINYMIMRANTIHYCPEEKKNNIGKNSKPKTQNKKFIKGNKKMKKKARFYHKRIKDEAFD